MVPKPLLLRFWCFIFTRPISAGGGTLSFTLEPNQPAEFTGPGTLYLNSGVFFPYAKFISYFIAEDGFGMPGQRVIAGPSGSFAISVEKSVDLLSWSPVLMQNTSDRSEERRVGKEGRSR